MKNCLLGIFVLLWGGVAQAEPAADAYATVGDWEITADGNKRCSMSQVFTSVLADGVEVLAVIYDAKLEAWFLAGQAISPNFC